MIEVVQDVQIVQVVQVVQVVRVVQVVKVVGLDDTHTEDMSHSQMLGKVEYG